MLRQFLNIVVREYETRLYALHRIDLPKNLFYESTEDATAQEVPKAEVANAEKKNGEWPQTFLNLTDLPRPEIFFCSQPAMISASKFHFFSLLPGLGEDHVMFANPSANVSVFDVERQAIVAMSPAKFRKPINSITLSITNSPSDSSQWSSQGEYDLYVMSTEDGSFELLNYCRTSNSAYPNDWYWHPLPHVPLCAPYSPYTAPASPPFAAAVVDSSTICASSKEGTFAFDRLKGVWSQAGRWILPFHGAAEYVPEFRLWFGLNGSKSSKNRLCAYDLASSAMAEEAPPSQHAWDYLGGLPDDWYPSKSSLVNLGLGKFCITTQCFHKPSLKQEDYIDEGDVGGDGVTVLTGVEVVRGGNGLQMIKHKSQHYKLDNMGIQCVL